jgi:hypothetical protein
MSLLWLFVGIGGGIGGYGPVLLGADGLSLWSLLGGTVGSFVGLWAYRRLDLGD